MKVLTLCFLFRNDQILLGQKKRGFGQGKWNGFGGKLEKGESVEEAMLREVSEEIGVQILEFEKVGVVWETHPAWPDTLEVHIFTSKQFSGVPCESEEMKPDWFDLSQIPYGEMWEGDRVWIPKMLSGQQLELFIELNFDSKVLSFREA